MPRSRNVRLTPVQRDILWAIEEAGGDSLWTMWITVRSAHDAMTEDQFRVEFVDGLLGLSRLGYVSLVRDLADAAGATVELSNEELARLWVQPMGDVRDSVEIEMPSAGYEALGKPGGGQRPASRRALFARWEAAARRADLPEDDAMQLAGEAVQAVRRTSPG